MSARRRLPVVPARVEGGRVYYTEYSWQEQHCGRRGPSWLNACRLCTGKPRCGCSAYNKALSNRMHAPFGAPLGMDDMRRTGLLRRGEVDEAVSPTQALRLVRKYLPHVRTVEQLFVETAWQPFKVVFERGWVGYVNYGLVLWAKAKAAGEAAPWELRASSPPRIGKRRSARGLPATPRPAAA